jgi:hypothetical protein
MNFDDWAFRQCFVLGHTIEAIKNKAGENINWKNTTTGELYNKTIQ